MKTTCLITLLLSIAACTTQPQFSPVPGPSNGTNRAAVKVSVPLSDAWAPPTPAHATALALHAATANLVVITNPPTHYLYWPAYTVGAVSDYYLEYGPDTNSMTNTLDCGLSTTQSLSDGVLPHVPSYYRLRALVSGPGLTNVITPPSNVVPITENPAK